MFQTRSFPDTGKSQVINKGNPLAGEDKEHGTSRTGLLEAKSRSGILRKILQSYRPHTK
jgi:hypothetical protein